jgi:hypothetical protein
LRGKTNHPASGISGSGVICFVGFQPKPVRVKFSFVPKTFEHLPLRVAQP